MGDNAINPTGAGGFNFEQGVGTDNKEYAWVTTLPPDLKAKFDKLDTAPPEAKAALAKKLIEDGLAEFDAAADKAKLSPEQRALWREALKESLEASAGTIFMDKLSAEKMAGMTIEELMFYVMSERTKGLDRQIREFANEIQQRNNKMEQANGYLAQARNMYASLDEGESATMPSDMVDFFNRNGISLPGDTGTGVMSKADPQTKIDAADKALKSMDGVAYADNACIKRDVPDDVMTFCAAHGIEVPKDGKSLQKKDLDELEGKINTYKAEAQAEKDAQTAAAASGTPAAEAPPAAKSMTRDEWDAAVQNMKGFLEGLNNQSELDMIKYQSVMSKYTSGIEMLSNTMKKLADSKASVVRNMS